MSELKHTPGPWTYAIYNVIGSDERPVALVASSDADRRAGKTLANGNLIAAAPDLLEVIESLLMNAPDCGCGLKSCSVCSPYKLYGRARAAIAKAKGGQL